MWILPFLSTDFWMLSATEMPFGEIHYFWWIGKNALPTEMIVKWINSHQWENKWEGDEERDHVIALKKNIFGPYSK